jgi:hypothetical protein
MALTCPFTSRRSMGTSLIHTWCTQYSPTAQLLEAAATCVRHTVAPLPLSWAEFHQKGGRFAVPDNSAACSQTGRFLEVRPNKEGACIAPQLHLRFCPVPLLLPHGSKFRCMQVHDARTAQRATQDPESKPVCSSTCRPRRLLGLRQRPPPLWPTPRWRPVMWPPGALPPQQPWWVAPALHIVSCTQQAPVGPHTSQQLCQHTAATLA